MKSIERAGPGHAGMGRVPSVSWEGRGGGSGPRRGGGGGKERVKHSTTKRRAPCAHPLPIALAQERQRVAPGFTRMGRSGFANSVCQRINPRWHRHVHDPAPCARAYEAHDTLFRTGAFIPLCPIRSDRFPKAFGPPTFGGPETLAAKCQRCLRRGRRRAAASLHFSGLPRPCSGRAQHGGDPAPAAAGRRRRPR